LKVVYIVVDTLRADHLGCYGYHRDTSPNIDRLAEESVVYDYAFPSDVPTQPSYTSMFTGLRGINNGVVSHSASETLSEDIPFLPEALAQNGITTAAVSTLYSMRRWFARGFQQYMNPAAGNPRLIQQVNAEDINNLALPWIRDHKDEDFFLFLHYWDPHGLYMPPEEYRGLFYDGDPYDPGNHSLDILKAHPIWSFTKSQIDAIGEGITDLEYIVAQYDGEIRYTDDHIKQLLDHLDVLGIDDETVIILTSDHGESMGEHHFYFDHFEVYDTTIHVPLIMRHPQGTPEGKHVTDLIQSTTSIAPTVLNLFDLDLPSYMKGKDLTKVANDIEQGDPVIYSNQGLWTAKRAMRIKEWKLIKTTHKAFWDTPEKELFRIDRDPGETENLTDTESEIVDMMELEMTRWAERELQGKPDPLDLIVSYGLPVYDWVEIVSKRTGLLNTYEEWRSRVDRAEETRLRKGSVKPPRW
jgi:arylsulfatase